jgi:hypothetical protein
MAPRGHIQSGKVRSELIQVSQVSEFIEQVAHLKLH